MTDILTHMKMLDCKPVATPMASKRVSLPQADDLYFDITEYRCIVGTLQYLTLTCPDLSYAVNTGTLSLGVRILRKSSLDLFAFSDANWAGCPITRRSTTGFCTFLGSNCISWSAKKQPIVSHSSTEAEYRAMASTAAELTWLSFILRDIGIYQAQPPTLFCDNLSALHMSVNPFFILAPSTSPLTINLFGKKLLSALSLLVLFHLLPN
uniref:Reverse transcriptase Ty1/copia-type domain-containing protein n=1 Tax=Fagus sylvatica TaxID=28930 RepID=A0A2N9FMY8_FAGSY